MQADTKSYDDINITPMVDLYLVLLLIFIIMTTAGVQGLKVDLPRASKQAPNLGVPKTQAVTVNSEGKIFLNTIPIGKDELETRLSQLKSETPDLPVVVRGDRATQYQLIMEVIEIIGRAGVTQIGLATQPAK